MCLTLLKVFGLFLTHITGNTVLHEVWSHGLHITAFLYALAPWILSLMVIRSLPGDIMSVLPLLCLGCISLGERKISPFYLLPKNKTFVFLDASNRSLFLSQRLILVLLLLLSLATMETASKREKNVGGFRYPPPPAAHPMPQLHVCPIPIPSPLCCMYYRICIFSFFFFLPFLSSSSLAFKIMKLCCGPCPLFSSSCSPWWCVGEVGCGDPQIYISPTALSLLLYY